MLLRYFYHVIVKPWSKSKPLSQQTPKLNKSPPKKGKKKDLDQTRTLTRLAVDWVKPGLTYKLHINGPKRVPEAQGLYIYGQVFRLFGGRKKVGNLAQSGFLGISGHFLGLTQGINWLQIESEKGVNMNS